MERIDKIQSDGFNPKSQVARANTISSRETLEIRVELQKLYKNVVAENSEATNNSNPAPTFSDEQTIENNDKTAGIRKGIKNIIYQYPIGNSESLL